MKRMITALILVMVLNCLAPMALAYSQDTYSDADFAALTTATVLPSSDSPTGYIVSFRYEDKDAQRVRLFGEWGYQDADKNSVADVDWVPGLVNTGFTYYELEKNDAGIWTVDVPVPSGLYGYRFYVGGEDRPADAGFGWSPVTSGGTVTWDPTNRPTNNDEIMQDGQGNDYYLSTVFVPFDAEKQTEDFTVEGPRDDEYAGRVEFLQLSGETVGEQTFTLYLPHNYDSAKTYNLMVLFHGGGGFYANWINNGAAANIADNLIAEGRFGDDTLILMPDGTALGWDGEATLAFLKEIVLPYMQENYNISMDRENLAFGGLSMGGILTSYMLFNAQDVFQTFIIFSGSRASGAYSYDQFKSLVGTDLKILVTVGELDIAYADIMGLRDAFDTLGVNYTPRVTAGGHCWYTWRKDLAYTLENFLWK